ncbi:MAG: DUF2333 family protein [Proteobacteria bacterium]|nr:DUF2333 family protein [Pseudomonadota bacterium]
MWDGIKGFLGRSFSNARDWARDWIGDRLADISGNTWRKLAVGALVLLALYYPVGMLVTHRIDDNLDFAYQSGQQPGGSHAVAVVSALIEREVGTHGWVMNDPFFKPSSLLDNMPNFQQGMFAAFARFAIELRDQIGRTRGSSTVDRDLNDAAGLLPYPGDVWIFNFSTSLFPTASAEQQYMKAQRALDSYNRRLASGEAVFDRRSDNLLATLDRIALDVGASSAAIDNHITEYSGDWLDFQADDLFYNIKGQTYGYAMILTALREDFTDIIAARDVTNIYDQMLASFRAVAALDPLVVTNNELDDQFIPNHLAAQGFYLLRARTQLREITNILLK